MTVPSASYSITVRVQLGADPLGIGRITTAVGEAAGTVVAVDIVESHPDLLVVDLTCNAADARHADAITRAVGDVAGARVHTVSEPCCLVQSPERVVPVGAGKRHGRQDLRHHLPALGPGAALVTA
jgi:malate dehydrogenase (oxaloacetate-decarboxylating)